MKMKSVKKGRKVEVKIAAKKGRSEEEIKK